MKPEELKEIEQRLSRTTPGPHWTIQYGTNRALDDIAALITALKAEMEQVGHLRGLLYEYGRHQEGCSAACNTDDVTRKRYPCKCGYEREVENR